MADKRIQDLTSASLPLSGTELFVLQQSGAATKITADDLKNEYVALLNGHGGISNISYAPPIAPSLDGTLTVTLSDGTSYPVTVSNGNGIASIGIQYGIGSTADPTGVSSWSNSAVVPTDAEPYAFTKITITDTTGNATDAYTISVKPADPSIAVGTVSATYGQTAAASITNSGTVHDPVLDFQFTLPQGAQGATGDYIVPVVTLGTSSAPNTEPLQWYAPNQFPGASGGEYVWSQTKYNLQDQGTTIRTEKSVIGYIGLNGGGGGTVTKVSINGVTFLEDGTGNVPIVIDKSNENTVGVIANPTTKYDGQVLTYDNTAGEWVAANPSTGNVNTVNNIGVDVGTTNISLYASDIKMSSGDNTSVSANFPTSGTPAALGVANNGSATTFARSDHIHPLPDGLLPSGMAFITAQISGNSSSTFTIGKGNGGFVFVTGGGASTTSKDIFAFNFTTAGTFTSTQIGTSSNISLTGTTAGILTVANSAATAAKAFVMYST